MTDYLLATCLQQHQTDGMPDVPSGEYQALLKQHTEK